MTMNFQHNSNISGRLTARKKKTWQKKRLEQQERNLSFLQGKNICTSKRQNLTTRNNYSIIMIKQKPISRRRVALKATRLELHLSRWSATQACLGHNLRDSLFHFLGSPTVTNIVSSSSLRNTMMWANILQHNTNIHKQASQSTSSSHSATCMRTGGRFFGPPVPLLLWSLA